MIPPNMPPTQHEPDRIYRERRVLTKHFWRRSSAVQAAADINRDAPKAAWQGIRAERRSRWIGYEVSITYWHWEPAGQWTIV